MRTVKRVLIGCEVLTLLLGLTTLGSGCGGSTSSPSGGVSIEEQAKKTEDARGAMEAASKAQKSAKK